jgi:hypothetical protein
MAYAAGLTAVRDGNGVAVPGSVRSIDESGAGSGPWLPVAVLMGGSGVASAAEVVNADEAPASTKYGLLVRAVGLLTALGAVTETAPATDIASSGLNGRLQRVAQNLTSLTAALVAKTVQPPSEYETVAAGQTAQVLGATGAAGDYIEGILITPAVVACGAVTLIDNATSITIFVGGGTTALIDAKPFYVPLKLTSVSGAWKITTGANVSVIASGNFT